MSDIIFILIFVPIVLGVAWYGFVIWLAYKLARKLLAELADAVPRVEEEVNRALAMYSQNPARIPEADKRKLGSNVGYLLATFAKLQTQNSQLARVQTELYQTRIDCIRSSCASIGIMPHEWAT